MCFSVAQITKMLAGGAAGTAAWVTNVSKEYEQVLMSSPQPTGQERLVLPGHRVPGVRFLSQEGGGLVAGHLRTAGQNHEEFPAVLTYK